MQQVYGSRSRPGQVIVAVLILVAALLFSFLLGRFALGTFYRAVYPTHYSDLVEMYSAQYNVSQELVYAVIRTESSFRPGVESSVGARGLMQITQDAFDWLHYRLGDEAVDLTYDDLYDPEVNIQYGTWMLSLLLTEFGSIPNALCAYHAGWGKTKEWLASEAHSTDGEVVNIPYPDTRQYVEKVMETMEMYKRIYAG